MEGFLKTEGGQCYRKVIKVQYGHWIGNLPKVK